MQRRPFTSLVAAVIAGVVAAVLSGPAVAFERADYTDAAFKAAQDAGKSIVVDVFAPWCPTCKAQHQVFETLKDKPEFAKVVLMKVDFDTQQDVVRAFKARSQSTLIAYKGKQETARSAGDTNAGNIEALITSTLR